MIRLRPFLLGTLCGLLLAALALALLIRFLPHLLVVRHQAAPADAIIVLGGDADGSRLRTGMRLHDDKIAPRLILVSGSNKGWETVLRKFCPDCTLEGRGAILLDGSLDTRTDAEISLAYCRANNLHKILVVTSPYHTRRAQFIFNDIAEKLKSSDQLSVTGDQKNRDQLPVTSDQKNRDQLPVTSDQKNRDQLPVTGEQKPPGQVSTDHGSLITNHASIEVTILSSGAYGNLLPPASQWWRDRRTLETVWLEFGKILYWELTPFMEFQGEGMRLKDSEIAR